MMTHKDACNILRIPFEANLKAAKKAWRKLTKEHHPDKGGDPLKFQLIMDAWECLEKTIPERQAQNYEERRKAEEEQRRKAEEERRRKAEEKRDLAAIRKWIPAAAAGLLNIIFFFVMVSRYEEMVEHYEAIDLHMDRPYTERKKFYEAIGLHTDRPYSSSLDDLTELDKYFNTLRPRKGALYPPEHLFCLANLLLVLAVIWAMSDKLLARLKN